MTPFELALDNALQIEGERFFNQWIFKWYGMTYEGGKTDVEDFRGGRITYAGIAFGSQQQQIYWQAIDRYLMLKVHEFFQKWEIETKEYSAATRLASIDGVERTLRRFVLGVIRRAMETDARLRKISDTIPAGTGGGRAGQEIMRLGQAHRELLKEEIKRTAQPDRKPFQVWKWLETVYANNPALIWLVRGIVAIGIGAAGYFLWLFRWIFG